EVGGKGGGVLTRGQGFGGVKAERLDDPRQHVPRGEPLPIPEPRSRGEVTADTISELVVSGHSVHTLIVACPCRDGKDKGGTFVLFLPVRPGTAPDEVVKVG